jgi:hypothetical protein
MKRSATAASQACIAYGDESMVAGVREDLVQDPLVLRSVVNKRRSAYGGVYTA